MKMFDFRKYIMEHDAIYRSLGRKHDMECLGGPLTISMVGGVYKQANAYANMLSVLKHFPLDI